MIPWHVYLAFVVAASIVLAIPGPTIILVIGHALTCGRRAAVPLAIGVVLGDLTSMTVSLLGLGAVLQASGTVFLALKWAGAIYLLYLGVGLWRSPVQDPGSKASQNGNNQSGLDDGLAPSPPAPLSQGEKGAWRLLGSAYVVTASNPKTILFFTAFLPQFVDPSRPHGPQLVQLGATFLMLASINAALYGLLAGQVSHVLASGRVRRWINRCGGTALIGAGLLLLTARRPS
jgi:threonine/homoserine/homoserine lactone efflux protein